MMAAKNWSSARKARIVETPSKVSPNWLKMGERVTWDDDIDRGDGGRWWGGRGQFREEVGKRERRREG
jgi:hypothetical protein